MTPDTIERALTDPDFLIELATKLKEEKSKREQAEKEKQILEEEKVKALPKIQVFDSIINQDGLFSIRSTAKTIQVPERKFIDFLIEKKVVFRNPQGNLEPFAKTIDKGLMEIKLVETEKGGARSQAKFTSYGMAWITLLVDKYSSYFPPELTSSPCKQN
jgi:phage antirepressor YoqD-like protein